MRLLRGWRDWVSLAWFCVTGQGRQVHACPLCNGKGTVRE